jgi:hypothetical protein
MQMAEFIARTQLVGSPSETVYEDLHAAMEGIGFLRERAWGSKIYELPHGTYCGTSTSAMSVVEKAIENAVKPIWSGCRILLVEVKDITGLLSPKK